MSGQSARYELRNRPGEGEGERRILSISIPSYKSMVVFSYITSEGVGSMSASNSVDSCIHPKTTTGMLDRRPFRKRWMHMGTRDKLSVTIDNRKRSKDDTWLKGEWARMRPNDYVSTARSSNARVWWQFHEIQPEFVDKIVLLWFDSREPGERDVTEGGKALVKADFEILISYVRVEHQEIIEGWDVGYFVECLSGESSEEVTVQLSCTMGCYKMCIYDVGFR
jgi:hypothetical protein